MSRISVGPIELDALPADWCYKHASAAKERCRSGSRYLSDMTRTQTGSSNIDWGPKKNKCGVDTRTAKKEKEKRR